LQQGDAGVEREHTIGVLRRPLVGLQRTPGEARRGEVDGEASADRTEIPRVLQFDGFGDAAVQLPPSGGAD
jgi:hypothetical protein